MTVTTETQWCVRFVGDYFTLTTQVYASDEDEAIAIPIERATWVRHGVHIR